jgi:hypothetical protein
MGASQWQVFKNVMGFNARPTESMFDPNSGGNQFRAHVWMLLLFLGIVLFL